jgi:hypothetical protein
VDARTPIAANRGEETEAHAELVEERSAALGQIGTRVAELSPCEHIVTLEHFVNENQPEPGATASVSLLIVLTS